MAPVLLGGGICCSGVGVVSGPVRVSGLGIDHHPLDPGAGEDGSDLVEDNRVLDPVREPLAATAVLDPAGDGGVHEATLPSLGRLAM